VNDNEPLALGDRVRRRDQPWLTGTVWSVTEPICKGWITVEWDDNDDECIYVPMGRLVVAAIKQRCSKGSGTWFPLAVEWLEGEF
jgi:hypothetical protein